jgi:hypothetical protein
VTRDIPLADHGAVHELTEGIDVIAIATADRPGPFRRGLLSYVANASRHGRRPRFVIADDSRDSANRRAVRRACVDLRRSGADVVCLGAAERRELRQLARDAGAPDTVVRTLLPEPGVARSAGAARNIILLRTAGSRTVMADDDTVCAPWRPSGAESGVQLIGHADPRDTEVFETREQALSSGDDPGIDVIAEHAAVLGRTLRDLENRAGAPSGTDRACEFFTRSRAVETERRKVRATWTGVAGDAAVYCPYPILFSPEPARSRLAADESQFRLALTSREVRRSVRQVSITHEPWFMAYCAGLDNTDLLPPFSSLAYSEDGLFGAMLGTCDPHALIAQLPVGIVHASQRASRYDPSRIMSAAHVRLSDVVHGLTAAWSVPADVLSTRGRLRDFGRYLATVADADPAVFRERMTSLVIDLKGRMLRACQSVLQSRYAYPTYWQDATIAYRQAVLTSLASPRMAVPLELDDVRDTVRALSVLQSHVRDFGEALEWWPRVWDASRDRFGSGTTVPEVPREI